MSRKSSADKYAEGPVPFSVLLLWVFGGISFALIVYLFTPFTHNLDDIKVTLQYVLAPIVWGLFAVALWRGHIQPIHPLLILSLIAFFLVMLLSALLADFPWNAWHDLGFHLTIASPFLVVAGTVSTEKRFLNMVLYYFLIGCGTVAFGLFHYLGGIDALFSTIYPGGEMPRGGSSLFTLLYTLSMNEDMLSTILNRDFYPAYLLMIVPLGIAMMIDYPKVWQKVFFLGFFFFMCICTLLAFSKDTYLALFIMTVLFVALYAAEQNWRAVPGRVVAIWTVGGLLLFATAIYVVRGKFAGLNHETFISVVSRKVIWGGGLAIFFDPARPFLDFLKHLLLGGGPGAFYLGFPNYRSPDYHLYEISHVTLFSHNQYIDLLCEEGLLGFLLFMFFLISIFVLLFRQLKRIRTHRLTVYQVALFTSLAGISFQNIFSPNIRWTVCGFNYWFLLGLATAAAQLTFTPDEKRRVARFYDFSPALKRNLCVALFVFALVFEAISIPYGLIRFNAAKENNDGLIALNELTQRGDLLAASEKYRKDPQFIQETRQAGEETLDHFKRALRWQPSFITSYYKLAHVYSRLAGLPGSDATVWWRRAKDTYDALRQYAPDYSQIHYNYGILGWYFFIEARDPEQLASALRAFHRAAEMSTELSVQDRYREVLMSTASHLAGLAAQERATTSPVLAETVRQLVPVLREIGPEKEDDPFYAETLDELGRVVQSRNLVRAARTEMNLLQDLGTEVARYMLRIPHPAGEEETRIISRIRRDLVQQYWMRGQYTEAVPLLEHLVLSDIGGTETLNLYVFSAIQAREPARAVKTLSKLIDRNPLDWATRDAARELLEQMGLYEEALKQTQALKHLFAPEKGAVGRAAMASGGISEAELYYRTAYAAEQLARKAEKGSQEQIDYYEQAWESYTQAAENAPDSEWGVKAGKAINRLMFQIPEATTGTAAATE